MFLNLLTISKKKTFHIIFFLFFNFQPVKAPTATATPVTSNYVFYRGTYFQVGDIVSMQDIDGGIYYAQIRGLLTDQYCEKSAAVTWLLPTSARQIIIDY